MHEAADSTPEKHWKIPEKQRQRIRMVLLRERHDAAGDRRG
jgi:hypothetical protein